MLTSMTPGSGVTLKLLQARIAAGRRIAFDEHRLAELLGGVLDRGDEIEIILGALGRRHEDVEMAVARLEGDARCARCCRPSAPTPGRSPRSGASARRQASRRASPSPLVVGRHAALLAAQHRRAAEGFERRQVGMRHHRVGLDDEVHVRRRGPRQRIERQAIADRRIARDQVALLGAQEPRPAAPAAAAVVLALRWAARSRRRFRGPSRTPAPGARAPSGPSPSLASTVTLLGRRRSRHR